MKNYSFTVYFHIFKKVIVVFSLFFCAPFAFAIDLSFKEKSPVDRLYHENNQEMDSLREEQKFKFDPNLKIAQQDRSYQSLLDQRDEIEKSLHNPIRPCYNNPTEPGCTGHSAWMNNPPKNQSMLEQKYHNDF
jgi:hypothetical protein